MESENIRATVRGESASLRRVLAVAGANTAKVESLTDAGWTRYLTAAAARLESVADLGITPSDEAYLRLCCVVALWIGHTGHSWLSDAAVRDLAIAVQV